MKRFTIYVEHTVLTTQTSCLVVTDEADMKQQLARREAELRAAPFVAKPQKDKQGKPIFHALNKDWDLS